MAGEIESEIKHLSSYRAFHLDCDKILLSFNKCKDIITYGLKKHFILTLKSLLKAKRLNKKYKKDLIPFEEVKQSMLSFIFKIDNYQEAAKIFMEKRK